VYRYQWEGAVNNANAQSSRTPTHTCEYDFSHYFCACPVPVYILSYWYLYVDFEAGTYVVDCVRDWPCFCYWVYPMHLAGFSADWLLMSGFCKVSWRDGTLYFHENLVFKLNAPLCPVTDRSPTDWPTDLQRREATTNGSITKWALFCPSSRQD
jgi:hypothetical protein